ncbi:MAG: hypothetical protein U0Z44_04955 [Kouleothrix sp.]
MTTDHDIQPNDADLELLSAYIDRQLGQPDRARLEQRLASEPALRIALDELRSTVGLLRDLPPARPPRSFTLDPQAVAPRRGWSFPWMQFSSALVAATLLVVFGFMLTRGLGGAPTASQAPAAAPTSLAAAPMAAELAAAPTSAPAAAAPTAAPMAAAAAAPTTDPGALAQADTALIGTATPDQASGGALPASAAPEPTPGLLAGAPEAGSAAQAKQSSTPTSLPTLTQPYLAQIATSVNSSPGTTTLDQPPLATPAGPGTGTQPGGTLLVLGALVLALLIGIGFVLARRRH